METKIKIKHWLTGSVLFEFEKENNTVKDTVIEAVKQKADLSAADLRYANLSAADLRYANLRYANLSSADLSYANLSSANLSSANIRSANLSYADLSYANLSYANLRYADLSAADLRYADLRYANLSYADLSYANLSYAKTAKRYIQISCIGSSKRITTYCFEDDIVWCGCFKGTLNEFEAKVINTHSGNDQYLAEYLGFINYLRSLKSK